MLFDAQDRPCDYRFIEVNPAFERQSGLVNPLGRTIRELVPGIEDAYIETYGRVALTGEPIRFESHASALGRWFDAFAFRIGAPADRRVALLFTDITERKLAQNALIEREFELREAHRLAGTGAWYWDLAEDRTDASPELLRIFGLEEHARLPPFAEQRGVLYPAADWERLNDAAQHALRTGEPYAVDVRAFRNGRPIWVTARASAVRAPDGRIVGLRGTLQDITERKQIEEALREADTRKDEFLATLAHELRNPLAPLRNGLAILRHADHGSPVADRARELMERQLAHMVRLVDDLLDVSRVTQGKIVLKKAPTPLQAVVDLALETSRPVIDGAGHSLRVELPEAPVLVDVDATRMSQVLSNVLNNAAKYTPRGGRIELRAQLVPQGRLRVEVADNGVGIPPDMTERVFDLFTQVGVSLPHSQGGLGIGLSLARRLVELHGGTIHATSTGVGQGSTFVIELPLQARAAEPPAQHAAGRPAAKATVRRVLVVDDNADAAETLRLLLELEGHAVQVVHTGADALSAMRRNPPEVVFLDIGLPDMDGYEVAARVRAQPALRSLRLVALTGWGAERDQRRARAAGFDLHLTKPVGPDDLAPALQPQAAEEAPGE